MCVESWGDYSVPPNPISRLKRKVRENDEGRGRKKEREREK